MEELKWLLEEYQIFMKELILEQIIDVCWAKSLWKINYEEFENYLELNEVEYNEDDQFFITSQTQRLQNVTNKWLYLWRKIAF